MICSNDTLSAISFLNVHRPGEKYILCGVLFLLPCTLSKYRLLQSQPEIWGSFPVPPTQQWLCTCWMLVGFHSLQIRSFMRLWKEILRVLWNHWMNIVWLGLVFSLTHLENPSVFSGGNRIVAVSVQHTTWWVSCGCSQELNQVTKECNFPHPGPCLNQLTYCADWLAFLNSEKDDITEYRKLLIN